MTRREERIRLVARPGILIGVVTSCAVLTGAGFLAGTQVKSPADAAAERAPSAIITFAKVEERAVSPNVTLQGKVTAQSTVSIPAFVPEGTARAVVTQTPLQGGATVSDGSVLVGVSGRPVIAFLLTTPLYRSLHFGDEGEDVSSVQQKLKDLSFYKGRVTGKVDTATQSAVAKLYNSLGYEPPAPSAELEAAARDAEKALNEATQAAPLDSALIRSLTAQAQAAKAAAGTWIDLDEWFSVPGGAMVTTAPVAGSVLEAGQPALSLSVGKRTVTTRANLLQLESLPLGAQVKIALVGAQDSTLTGEVLAIGPFVEANSQDGSSGSQTGKDVTIEIPEQENDDVPADAAVQVSTATNAPPGPAVPLSALRQDSSGTYVLVKTEAAPRRVNVSVSRQADGWAALADSGSLRTGDSVVTSA